MDPASSPETTGTGGTGRANSPPLPPSVDPSIISSTSAPDPNRKRHGKRERVALACQRCKTRKQKCEGGRPACASCARLSLKCVYIVPLIPAAGEKKLYIKALEQRVAELESHLASLGQFGVGEDHLPLSSSLPGLLSTSPNATQQQHPVPSMFQMENQIEQPPSDDEENDILVAVRDLSLSASGHYVGATSNITIGRVLSSVVHSQRSQPPGRRHSTVEDDDPTPKSICAPRMTDMIGVPFLSARVAQRLLQGWFTHIATRYPVLATPRVLALHAERESLTDVYESSILHLVYAVSGRWLESSGEMGHFFSDQHYDLAFESMDTILQLRDSRAIDYLLLMALYCTRAPRDPGAWTYVGAAMKLCIELGLHRKPRRQTPTMQAEMNRRRFWTAYFLDRDISIALGRPPSISDHDIDADPPLDVDEATSDDEVVRQAMLHPTNFPRNPPTTLTPFLHRLRLKRIESEIQHAVYRVDQPLKVPDSVIHGFLDRLNGWKDAIPFEARNFVHQAGIPYDGLEFYTIHYHRCVRFLLYPQLAHPPKGESSSSSSSSVDMQYLRLCADACAGITADYRRLHHVFPVGFSALSIQSVFLAGLTLIYCAWLAPANFLNVDGPLTDCQILLYIITERYPSARKYRDIFERIKTAILSLIQRGEHRPRIPVGEMMSDGMDADVRALSEGSWAGMGIGMGGLGADFTQMISQMTGQALGMEMEDGGVIGMQGVDTGRVEDQAGPGRVRGNAAPGLGIWSGMSGMQGMQGMEGMEGIY